MAEAIGNRNNVPTRTVTVRPSTGGERKAPATTENSGRLTATNANDRKSAAPVNQGPGRLTASNSGAPKAEGPNVDRVTLSRESQEGLWDTANRRFDNWDADHNGQITNQEVQGALRNGSPLTTSERATLETLRNRQDELQAAHNDHWGLESGGFTRNDLQAYRNAGDGEAARLEEQFNIERGLATEDQSVRDRATANGPADLSGEIGTRDYYIDRYRDFRRRNPNEAAPDYYLNYGLKYFDRFHRTSGNFGPEAQQWIERTGVSLQTAMEGRRGQADYANLERNADEFRSFAYGTHADAYVNSGLHSTNSVDRWNIFMTPDGSDLRTWDGVGQAIETGTRVLLQDQGEAYLANAEYGGMNMVL
ncbi:hypothetical protein ABS71_14275 [bacterium SCN 62-11]|nr:MAG: hypothetical protein ABS71_14275 [bacterium SCN 62-11]